MFTIKSAYKAFSFIVLLHVASTAPAQTHKVFNPLDNYQRASKRADSLCNLLTLDEKLDLIRGYKSFNIAPIPKHNIPKITMSDASQGLRLVDTAIVNSTPASTAFPAPIVLASTWNTNLAHEYAKSIGEECRTAGINILLGPGMNIYRNAQCGRNFEYLGEDPFLTSRMVENYVQGLQSTGTMATLKHYLANNTDLDRRVSNSIVDERAIHEIYTKGFKAGIDAGAMGVMTSYNLVNGEWAGQNKYAITDLLRHDLGFKGLVMTDWTSVWDAEKIIKSGQDLEMPNGNNLKNAKNLLDSNKVLIIDINGMVKSILTACISMGFYDRPQRINDYVNNYPAHEQVALQTAREGIVLLKNSNGLLPIKTGNILVTGKFIDKNPAGQGSALVKGYDKVTLKTALQQQFQGRLTFAENPTDDEIKKADYVLLEIGTLDGEGQDRPFDLPAEDDERITRITSLNPKTVVVVNSGSGINMSRWNNQAGAIVYAWYPGQIGQVALAEILAGKTNPSGKLPISIEKDFKDSPAYGYEPENKKVTWKGFKNTQKNGDKSLVYDVNYKEGIFVGYRWYEHKKIQPLYPFGFGLSYTNFAYSNLKLNSSDFKKSNTITVSFDVKNVGTKDGFETPQLYITDKASSIERPLKELKGFKKVFIKKGETQKVQITLHKQDFQFWHPQKKTWVMEPGEFEVLVGKSSADIALRGKFAL
jgi:beta-glucosidase